MPISGLQIPGAATVGPLGALVGVGAVRGSLEGALVLYWALRISLCFCSCKELFWATLRADIAFDKSLQRLVSPCSVHL